MIEQFGPYTLEGLLGAGGMGEVFRATDRRTGQRIALKRLPNGSVDDEYRRRFSREARIIQGLRQRHIVPIHEVGELEGRLYIAMQLINGLNLHELILRDGPFNATRAVDIVAQVAEALDVAHGADLVHRDIKPANVVVEERQGGEFAYLIDFGIARAVFDSRITATGSAIGTPAYMAPELYRGYGDHRADTYALGCVLFELLAGSPVFPGDSPPVLMRAHLQDAPPRVSEHRSDVNSAMGDVIFRALAKNPIDRYSTTLEFALEARTALTQSRFANDSRIRRSLAPTVISRPPSQPERTIVETSKPLAEQFEKSSVRDTARWRPRSVSLIGLALALVAYFTLWPLLAKSSNDITTPPARAEPAARDGKLIGEIPFDTSEINRITVSPDGRGLYVAKQDSDSIDIIDLSNRSTINSPSIGDIPSAAVFSPDDSRAYVAEQHSDTVAVIDTKTKSVIRTIELSPDQLVRYPNAIAVSPDGRLLYVTEAIGNRLSILDVTRGKIAFEVDMSKTPEPVDLVLTPDGKFVYVANSGGNAVSVIDTRSRTLIKSIQLDSTPLKLTVTGDGSKVLVAENQAVLEIDVQTNTITRSYPDTSNATGVVVAPTGTLAYALQDDNLVTFDTATGAVVGRLRVGGYSLAIAPDGRRLYVCDRPGKRIVIVEPSA